MYGVTRFFYENYLQDATSLGRVTDAYGIISGVVKEGAGSAVMTAQAYDSSSGYNYFNDLLYTIEIDNVTGGKEITQATFKWRTNETLAGTWEETGHVTSTSIYQLSHGVYIKFTAGTGDDFSLGDKFYVVGKATFSITKSYDERRDTYLKTKAATASYYSWDLGSAKRVRVIALFDVLFSVGGLASIVYVRVTAGTTGDCGDYTHDFALTSPHMYLYLDQTYRYWKIRIQSSTSEISYIGQVFIGDYVELVSSPDPDWGAGQTTLSVLKGETIQSNVTQLRLEWNTVNNTDTDILHTMFLAVKNETDHLEHPVFLHLFSDEGDFLYWMKVVSDFNRKYVFVNINSVSLTFAEVPKAYVI